MHRLAVEHGKPLPDVRSGTCVDMCVAVCVDMCLDMWSGMCQHDRRLALSTQTAAGVRSGMRADVDVGICFDMWLGMCQHDRPLALEHSKPLHVCVRAHVWTCAWPCVWPCV